MPPIERAARLVLLVIVVTVVVLVGTGVWLSFTYQPDAAQAWPGLGADPGGIAWARLVHRLATGVLIPLALAYLVVRTVASGRWRAATGVLVVSAAIGYTGFRLAWDQLALWAVTVGENYQGMWAAGFSDDVRFVLVGGVEVSQATLRLWFLTHVGLSIVLVGVLAAAARGLYRSPATPPSPVPTGSPSNQSSTIAS